MTRRDRVDDTDSDVGGDPAPEREHSPDDARPPGSDPRRIGSVAVTGSDVIDALEATARGDRKIVLRITPPFSGRMRARLHDAGAVDSGADADAPDPEADAAPVHLPPERLAADPPAYPTVDDTEDELRASETPYTRKRHRERHQAAVEEWRATVRERLVEETTIDTDAGPTTVSVSYLG